MQPMQSVCTYLPYSSTGYFSTIVTDYINAKDDLKPFYDFAPNIEGVKAAIAKRREFTTNRNLLVQVLKDQYQHATLSAKQQLYIEQLGSENTFTVCTAHQPNIFTGYLYFIYKIVHAIKLAETLTEEIAGCNFVPVYYMGSEDADLEELGHIFLGGRKYEWKTKQQGAVGRMKVDKALLQLVNEISGQLLVHPYGNEITGLMHNCYKEGATIQQATFDFINNLFATYGLLIVLPDNRLLKNEFASVIKKELLEQFSHKAVEQSVKKISAKYKVQAAGRQLNLFYLTDEGRERIEAVDGEWLVVNGQRKFTEGEIINELKEFPERFSPNVILRPVFQEMILPNIAFIGGGGEIAYWLELKKVFEAVAVPYPVLVLRNSFLLMDDNSSELVKKLKLSAEQIFIPEFDMMNMLVKKQSSNQLSLDKEKELLKELYSRLKITAGNIDTTLQPHTEALLKKALDKIEVLEKKILKAEKKKFEAQQRQLHKLKQQLFPNNNLQERVENFMLFYSKEGKEFIRRIYDNSLGLEQEFGILKGN